MRYVIVGDLHLGGGLYPPEFILDKLERYLHKLSPDRVILLGDVFDNSLPDPRWVFRLSKILNSFEWYFINGNHDVHVRLNRYSTMVFGDDGAVREVDEFLLIPWSVQLTEKQFGEDWFKRLIQSFDGKYILHHFTLSEYPKADLLAQVEFIAPCVVGKYQIAGHIHEGFIGSCGEHVGSFVPVKLNELFFDRWLLIFEDGNIKRENFTWPYHYLTGTVDEIISEFERLDFPEDVGVLYIESNNPSVLSYDFRVPDGWILKVKVRRETAEISPVSVNEKNDLVVDISIDTVVARLIDEDSFEDKKLLRGAWNEIKKAVS